MMITEVVTGNVLVDIGDWISGGGTREKGIHIDQSVVGKYLSKRECKPKKIIDNRYQKYSAWNEKKQIWKDFRVHAKRDCLFKAERQVFNYIE